MPPPSVKIRQDVQAVMQQNLADVGIKLELTQWMTRLFFASYAEMGRLPEVNIDMQEWSDGPLFPDPDIYYWLCDQIPTDA